VLVAALDLSLVVSNGLFSGPCAFLCFHIWLLFHMFIRATSGCLQLGGEYWESSTCQLEFDIFSRIREGCLSKRWSHDARAVARAFLCCKVVASWFL